MVHAAIVADVPVSEQMIVRCDSDGGDRSNGASNLDASATVANPALNVLTVSGPQIYWISRHFSPSGSGGATRIQVHLKKTTVSPIKGT
jgi:hypothetical protein